jgi:3',5'-cyclic AMP phosphodiesterase CpdA
MVLVLGTTMAGVAVRASEAAGAAATVWAAGDIAKCDNGAPASRAAADIVASDSRPFLALGDLAYPNGSAADFANCYNPVWGPMRSRTRPTPGNHEYRTAGAAGYLSYFGLTSTWYSWELNGWQILSLDSNCSSNGGCGPGSPQYTWLETQLRSSSRSCQLAYWHHPRWTQGAHGNEYTVGPLYQLLVSYGVELLLAGHDHIYERYAALDANKAPSPNGVVEIVVGTGGAERESGSTTNSPTPLVRNDTTFGAL